LKKTTKGEIRRDNVRDFLRYEVLRPEFG
jgi:hypothetical protein